MRHLGLDLSLTSTGIAVYDAQKRVVLHHESVGESLKEDDPEGVKLARMIGISKRICSVITKWEPQTVTIEGPAYGVFHQKGGRLFQLGGLYFVVATQIRLCFSQMVALPVSAPTARKVVLGRGMPPQGVKGKEVKEWVEKTLWVNQGLSTGQHDSNDALVVAIWRAIHEKDAPPEKVQPIQQSIWG